MSITPATPPFHFLLMFAQGTSWEPPRGEIGSPKVRAASLLLLLPLTGCDAPPYRDPFRATGETIAMSGGDGGAAAACFTCHGLKGEGDGKDSPRLAGLDAGYLHRQLDDYANGRREHLAMRTVALRLSDADRSKVASYYAALPPPHASAALANADGEELYRQGDPVRGLAPCASCHGADGEGDAANPPLAGQPAPYLEKQLAAWRTAKRNNDPLGEMRDISRRLSGAEMRAVSSFASGLRAGRPPGPAASPAGRRDDPRSDASAPRPHASGSSRPGG